MAPILSEEFAQCWKAVLGQYKSNLQKQLQTENGKRIHAESLLRFEDHPLLKMASLEEIDGLKLEEAQRVLLEFLPQFSQARLLICGSNEEPEMIADLAEKYIGSLCPLASKEKGSFLPVNFTPGYKIELKEGTVPNRSSYSFYFPFKKGVDPEIETKLAIARDFVHSHMNQKIRKELQLIYGIQFQTQRFSLASDWNFAQLSFQCKTSKADFLIKQIWNALNGILDLTEAELIDYLEKKKTEWRRVLANQTHDITYWSNTLVNYLEKDYSLHFISNRKNWYDNMTVFELKKMLHLLLERREEFKQIVLHPKIEPLKQALQAVSSS
jgi:predicted Zn-dependent peptidase